MIIREFEDRDKDKLIPLIEYLQDYMASFEPDILDAGKNISGQFLVNLLEDTKLNDGKIYVAEEKDELIGFISGRIEQGSDDIELIEKKYFYISNVVVLPGFQKGGIGTSLLSKIEEYAKSKGIKNMLLNVLFKNIEANNLYIKNGFSNYEKILLKKLI